MTWLWLSGPARRTTLPLTALVGVVVALLASVLTAVPMTARRATERSLQRHVATASVMQRSLRVALPPDPYLSVGTDRPDLGHDPADPFARVDRTVRQAVDEHAPGVLGPVLRVGMTGAPRPLTPLPPGDARAAHLAVSSDALSRVRWTAGRAPSDAVRTVRQDREVHPLVEVGISTEAARRWHAAVGTRWSLAPGPQGGRPVLAVVAGVYEPRDAHDDLWQWYPELSAVSVTADAEGGAVTTAALLLGTAQHARLDTAQTADMTYAWIRPVDPGHLRPQHLAGIADALVEIVGPTVSTSSPLIVQSALVTPVSRWRDEARALRQVDAALSTGLVVLAAAVLAMLLGLRASGRSGADRLLRVRGASATQLAVLGAVDVAPAVVFGASVGWVLAAAVAHEPGPALPAVALSAITTVAAAVAVVLAGRDRERADDHGLRAVASRAGRWVPGALLVAVTVTGVLTVRQRTPSRPATVPPHVLNERAATELADTAVPVDPLVQAVPALVSLCLGALAVAAVVLAARVAAGRAAKGRGAAGWLGLIQAVRTARASWLPLVALSVAVSLTVLGTTLMHTTQELSELRAWQRTGAHVRLDVVRADDADLTRARNLPGVEAVAPVGIRAGTLTGARRSTPVRILLADEPALRSVRQGTPLSLGEGRLMATPGTVVVSREIPWLLERGTVLRVGTTKVPYSRVVVDPTLDDDGGPPTVLVDPRRQGLRHVLAAWTSPTSVLVRTAPGREDDVADRLATELDEVTGTSTVRATRHEPPRQHLSLVVGVVVGCAALLSAVAVWTLAAAGAVSRRQLLARARVLGLGASARRQLVLLQLVPAALGAAAVGVATGLTLPPLLPRFVDLGAVVGGAAYPPLMPWWPAVAGASVLMIVLVLTVVALDLRATRHLSLTRHLRGGSR